jgi:DNA-binding transcriptional MocR family regulator
MARSNQGQLAGSHALSLPRGWADGGGSLHRRLADALGHLMARGDLPAGALLPTERDLAEVAGVSRATAAAAYRLLKADGRIDARQGRGTWVRDQGGTRRRAGEGIAPVLVHPDDAIDLSLAAAAPEPDLQRALADATRAAASDLTGVGYEPAGPTALRASICPGRPDRVLVTTGAQQALSLVVDELVRPDDVVVIEDVTYIGALDAARRAGARLVAVPTGPSGVDVDALRLAVERHRPALVYLNPTHQSPTGTVLPDAARHEIAALALATATPVIDDRVLADLAYDRGRRPRPMASFEPAAPILTLGSLSKTVWPGLRVGWVEAAPAMIERLVTRRMVDDLGGSVLSAQVALRLWDRRDEWATRRAEALAARHRHLSTLLARDLPEWVVEPTAGGTSLWARLPRGDGVSFGALAAEHGVHLVAGSSLSPHGAARRHLRLSVTVPEAVLDAAVDRIASAWEAYQEPPGRPRSLVV